MHVLEAHSTRGGAKQTPLVLLHGLSAAGVHFFPLLLALHRRIGRIVLVDLPGHGFSDSPPTLGAVELRAGIDEVLDAVIDAATGAVLVGNSLGGYAAIRYALDRPERVRGLFLISPAGAAMTEAELTALRASFALDSHGDALAFIDRLLAKPSRIRHLYAWGVRQHFSQPEVGAVLRAAVPDVLLRADELAALKPPVVLMWGQAERILPRRQLEFFRAHLPASARIETPAGLGHSPFLDDARRLGDRIVEFYDEVATPGST